MPKRYKVISENGDEYQTYDNEDAAKGRAARMSRSMVRSGNYRVVEEIYHTKAETTRYVNESEQSATNNSDDTPNMNDDTSADDSTDYPTYERRDTYTRRDDTSTDDEIEALNSGVSPLLQRVGEEFQGDDGKGNRVTEDPSNARWSLGTHSMGTSIDFDSEIAQAEQVNGELAGLLREAQGMVEGSSVKGFECNVCGLNHGHSDTKHDTRSAFNVTEDLVELSEFCPFCHCGVNEMAMLMDFYSILAPAVPFFTDSEMFEEVRELDNDTLQAIVTERRAGDRTIPRIVREDGHSDEVSESDFAALARFYRRWLNINQAASSAPIARETQEEISEFRDEVQEFCEDLVA